MGQSRSLLALAAGLVLAAPLAAAELRRGDDALSLAVRTTGSLADSASFEGAADLTAELGPIQTDVAASVQLGRGLASYWQPGALAATHGTNLSVKAGWATDLVDLSVGSAQRRLETATDVALTPQTLETQVLAQTDRSTVVTALLRPSATVNLSVAARSSSSQSLVGGTAAAASEQFSTSSGLVSAAQWQAAPTLALSTQVAVTRDRVAWEDTQAARYARSSVTPRLVATFAPSAGERLQLTAEHVLSPPVLLPDADDGTVRAQGEGEWRLVVDARRPLGEALSLTTGLTLAARQGTTEFGADGSGLQVPVSVASGLRRQVEVGLTADLSALGLSGATLTGTGVVRASSVADPVTGSSRRASGEVPAQAKLAFAQALPLRSARWGIDTYIDAASDYYGIRDVTRVSTASGLGAFVDYAPGPVRVQVRVDNLLGGDRDSRIDYYQGLRGQSDIDRIERRGVSGRAVSLTLSGKV